jgi:hypothetical protein
MPMTPFYTRFPKLFSQETRSATVKGWDDLPDGEYGFLEFYCDEENCDCRRVIINVVSSVRPYEALATINYGWENQEFYERWMRNKELAEECKGPVLDVLNPQSEYAPALLRLFQIVLQDPAYVQRLQRHYELFKGKGRAAEQVNKKAPIKRGRRKSNKSFPSNSD